jgi:hypothetical protein
MHVITFGTSFTRARQPSHAARKHEGPRGRWNFGLRASAIFPAATSAACDRLAALRFHRLAVELDRHGIAERRQAAGHGRLLAARGRALQSSRAPR